MHSAYPELAGKDILFYDGDCAFCDRAVQFYVTRDQGDRLRIAPLQGEFARQQLARCGVALPAAPPAPASAAVAYSTVYALQDFGGPAERLRSASRATGLLLTRLSGGWRMLGWLVLLLPAALLDPLYRLFARNRYRWFGHKAACLLPTPEQRARLIG